MRQLFLSIVLFLLAWASWAQPVKHPSCQPSSRIREPKNSGGFYFSSDCKTIYVLPPARASVRLAGAALSQNSAFCAFVNSTSEIMAAQLSDLKEKIGSDDSLLAYRPTLMSNADSGRKDVAPYLAQIRELEKALLEYLTDFGQIEGASLSLFFSTPFSELVNEFRRLNPKVSVLRMPGQAALSFDVKIADSLHLPAVLDLALPGLVLQLAPVPLAQAVAGRESTAVFSDSATGKVVLSAPAACAWLQDGGRVTNPAVHLVANVTFKYEVEVGRGYVISYDLNELMGRIKRATSVNGVFRTEALNELTNFNRSDEVIKVESYSQDVIIPMSPEVVAEAKRALLDRVLQQVARVYLPDNGPAELTLPAAPVAAAPALASKVAKCPHKYCMVGAVLIDLAHALFGGSESVAQWMRENHVSTQEIYSDKSMVEEFSSFGFQVQGVER